MHEVELGGMPHEVDADPVGMEFALQRIEYLNATLQEVAAEHQRELADEQQAEIMEPAALKPVGAERAEAGLAHDFVDDELGEQQRQWRLHGHDQAHHDGAHHQMGAGPPHLPEQPHEMAQRLQALALLERQDFGNFGGAHEGEAGRGVGQKLAVG